MGKRVLTKGEWKQVNDKKYEGVLIDKCKDPKDMQKVEVFIKYKRDGKNATGNGVVDITSGKANKQVNIAGQGQTASDISMVQITWKEKP